MTTHKEDQSVFIDGKRRCKGVCTNSKGDGSVRKNYRTLWTDTERMKQKCTSDGERRRSMCAFYQPIVLVVTLEFSKHRI